MKQGWMIVLAAVAAAGISLAGCGAEGGAAAADADALAGQELYNTGGASGIPCATCHSLDGTALVGPSLQGIGERAASRIEGVSAEEYLRQAILSPSAYLVSDFADTMPKTFGETLSEEDIDHLVAFLLTQ